MRRGLTLHSVEHCGQWLDEIQKQISIIPSSKDKWFPHHVPRQDGLVCTQNLTNDWASMDRIFGRYARFPREHLLDQSARPLVGFGFVSVDGRFRDGCLAEAASLIHTDQRMLLKKDYGVLLLDNAERQVYKMPDKLPSHWLVVSFDNAEYETALWMSCPAKDDVHCTRARNRIVEYMAALPIDVVGGRYKAHMARAKRDGVPGA